MVKNITRAALIAGAAAATTWSIRRWLELRSHAAKHAHTHQAIQDWENEGGAVMPHATGTIDSLGRHVH